MATDYTGVTAALVDESISQTELKRALELLLRRGVGNPTLIPIKELYSGLADERILASLLKRDRVLITCDRPLHNTVLSRGQHSLYWRGDTITDRALKGIHPRQLPAARAEVLEEGSYHPPAVPPRRHLMPESERDLKRLTTKRRRIRNHFGARTNWPSWP